MSYRVSTILVKELLDGHLLGVEHQRGHIIEVGVRPNDRTVVISRLISKRSITLDLGQKCMHEYEIISCRLVSFPRPVPSVSILHAKKWKAHIIS